MRNNIFFKYVGFFAGAFAGFGKSSKRGQKRDRPVDNGSGSDDDTSSLEESVEEHKQPQTEEIMNAELLARVFV